MRRTALLAIVVVVSFATSPCSIADTRPVPDTMRVAAVDKAGGPEVLSIHRVPVPTPSAGEVLIAVHGAGVAVWEAGNASASWRARAVSICSRRRRFGHHSRHGLRCARLQSGDEVYGTTGMGFYAEYVKARADRIAHIPKGIGLTEASILAISGTIRDSRDR